MINKFTSKQVHFESVEPDFQIVFSGQELVNVFHNLYC